MPNITGHTELVGLMAYPIRHTQSPTTHNLAYDKNGDDVIQLAFEVDNDTLEAAVESIRALKMLGSNISMPNKTVVHKYLDEAYKDTMRILQENIEVLHAMAKALMEVETINHEQIMNLFAYHQLNAPEPETTVQETPAETVEHSEPEEH
mgnify:CR=1 FL=1